MNYKIERRSFMRGAGGDRWDHGGSGAQRDSTPDPFVQTIVDVVVPRTVFGRVCLLGDAAFVVRPHTAGATAKAARDATVLATALKRARQNVDAGLRSFEDTQLEYGRDLVGYGVALGQRWASKHARKPQPY